MSSGRDIPAFGIVVALAAVAVLLFAGENPWLALAVLPVWIATLWLGAPPPPPARGDEDEAARLTPAGVSTLIEHSGLPMFVLDGERIAFANAAAREAMGAHVVGQDARVAFRHPAAIDLLAQPGSASTTIEGLTGPRSSWQISRQPIDERFALVELLNRTAEADISRAHTDFVANASHELRTPLASIIGYVETLADASVDVEPERRARFLDIVLREARRLQSLVEDLMSLSRIEAEKHDQPREVLDLAALAQRGARDGAGPERLERLQFEAKPAKLTVRGDANQLEQLVRNLVDNAMKYGAAGEPVSVAVGRGRKGWAALTVRDHGDGIEAEHIPHLTRRFYRTDPGRSLAAGGTGLGLAIVKHIVERHRGRLDIASRKGEGTTVTVSLPLAE